MCTLAQPPPGWYRLTMLVTAEPEQDLCLRLPVMREPAEVFREWHGGIPVIHGAQDVKTRSGDTGFANFHDHDTPPW